MPRYIITIDDGSFEPGPDSLARAATEQVVETFMKNRGPVKVTLFDEESGDVLDSYDNSDDPRWEDKD